MLYQTSSFANIQRSLAALEMQLGSSVHQFIPARLRQKSRPEDRIPLREKAVFVERVADVTDDPLLFLRAYTHLDWRGQQAVAMGLSSLSGAAEALVFLQRYLPLSTDLGTLTVHKRPDNWMIQFQPHLSFQGLRMQIEALLYSLSQLLLSVAPQAPIEIALPLNPPPAVREEYGRLFGIPVRFGAGHWTLRVDSRSIQYPRHDRSASLERIAYQERLLRRADPSRALVDSVAFLVRHSLASGEPRSVQLAELLAVSNRTFQRRLERGGGSLRQIVQHVRRVESARLLIAGTDNQTVARLLGYQQTGQFYRAFKGWYGLSPAQFRAKRGADGCRQNNRVGTI